ncbi:hypothetical protein [Brevundimonas sp.]|uniref:hypothetical protein n=1 Tax=Brevundimonas sp. TaxID=1871086 RepID=UPI003AF861CC
MISVLAALALLVPAPEPQDGPWRQLIDFTPTAEQPDGASLFLLEADMLPQGSPARRDARPVRYLWVNHGAVIGDQAVTLVTGTTDCDGEIRMQQVQVFTAAGRMLGEATVDEAVYAIPHSAESLISDAVCTGSPYLYDKPVVATLAEATAGAASSAGLGTPADAVRWDVDYDGQDDIVSIAMRPHSYRHDVEFVLAKTPNRSLNVVTAEQRPTGPLLERRIRPLERDRYLTACDMDEGEDVAPCVARYPLVQRGVEVVTEGQPTILVWLVNGEPRVARLPVAD